MSSDKNKKSLDEVVQEINNTIVKTAKDYTAHELNELKEKIEKFKKVSHEKTNNLKYVTPTFTYKTPKSRYIAKQLNSNQENLSEIENIINHYKNDILEHKNQNRLNDFLDEIRYPGDINVNDIEDIEYINGNVEIIFVDEYNCKSGFENSSKRENISSGYGVQHAGHQARKTTINSVSDTLEKFVLYNVSIHPADNPVAEEQPTNKANST